MITIQIRKQSTPLKRYSLIELLFGCTPKKIAEIKKRTRWARDGKAFGSEIEANK